MRIIYDAHQLAALELVKITHDKIIASVIKGRFSASSLALQMADPVKARIAAHLMRLGHMLSTSQVELCNAGQLALKTTAQNLKGRAGGDSKIETLPYTLQRPMKITMLAQEVMSNDPGSCMHACFT